MYEVHIAAEVLAPARRAALFAALSAIGLTKNKLFYQVVNIKNMEEACRHQTHGDTDHDLENPGSMTTAKVAEYADATRLICDGMRILANLGIQGNFELETIISPKEPDTTNLNMAAHFPGFRRIPTGPLYENHIMWKGPRSFLPSIDTMNRFFIDSFGLGLHQVVDFGRDPIPYDTTIVSRVATIYQPTREATLAFAARFTAAPNTLGYRNPVAEQVIVVGEPIHPVAP